MPLVVIREAADCRGDPQTLCLQPIPELGHEGHAASLTGGQALAGPHVSDLGIDAVEIGDPAQALGGDFGSVAVEDLLQLAPCVCPAVRNRERHAALGGGTRQSVVA